MSRPTTYNADTLLYAMDKAGISHPTERAMFLAQMSHESGGFRYDEEIASGKAYEGRRDLGNTQPGDGQKFKGRGFIQLTGRDNYERFGEKIGVDLVHNPDAAKDPEIAADIAVAYWKERVDRSAAQAGDVAAVTKDINGGFNGLQDRKERFTEYRSTLKQVEAAAAMSGLALPSDLALNAIIEDLRDTKPELAKTLEQAQKSYKAKDISKKELIESALVQLQADTKEQFSAAGLEQTPRNANLALHMGSRSALALLTSDDDTLVSDATVTIKGKKFSVNEKSFDSFIKEVRNAGVDVAEDVSFETATVADMKHYADLHYNAQVEKSVALSKRIADGKLKESEESELDFFSELMKGELGKDSNPIVMFLVTLLAFLANGDEQALGTQGRETLEGKPLTTPPIESPQKHIEQDQKENTQQLDSNVLRNISLISENLKNSGVNHDAKDKDAQSLQTEGFLSPPHTLSRSFKPSQEAALLF